MLQFKGQRSTTTSTRKKTFRFDKFLMNSTVVPDGLEHWHFRGQTEIEVVLLQVRLRISDTKLSTSKMSVSGTILCKVGQTGSTGTKFHPSPDIDRELGLSGSQIDHISLR